MRRTHGCSGGKTPEYRAWRNMINRCTQSGRRDFARYGGRGVRVCDRWLRSFADFLADVGLRPSPDHSLDRKDSNGHYEPSNCRWATRAEQGTNMRINVYIEHGGVRGTISQLARAHGLRPMVVSARLRGGWSVERALTTPVRS